MLATAVKNIANGAAACRNYPIINNGIIKAYAKDTIQCSIYETS